jgi:hypothetical protein
VTQNPVPKGVWVRFPPPHHLCETDAISAENSSTENLFLPVLRCHVKSHRHAILLISIDEISIDNIARIDVLTNAISVDFGKPIVGNFNFSRRRLNLNGKLKRRNGRGGFAFDFWLVGPSHPDCRKVFDWSGQSKNVYPESHWLGLKECHHCREPALALPSRFATRPRRVIGARPRQLPASRTCPGAHMTGHHRWY